MGTFKANPNAEVSAGFEAVRPGTYRMRIKSVEDRVSIGKTDYKVSLEHVASKDELVNKDGEALKGLPQNVFTYLPYDAERQGMLKAATLACGIAWGDYDPTVDLIGKECDVVLKIEPYNGVDGNKVARFVVPK